MPLKLKLDDAGNVAVQDGKPIYVDDDGKETAFDAASTLATISRLNGEAKGHREAKEAAEAKLKAFEGIDDPEKARAAMRTVANLDDKKLVDAGEVEKVKAEVAKVYETQLGELKKSNHGLESRLHGVLVGDSFARSKFIAEKVAVPVDLIEAQFGRHFKVENDQVVAYGPDGNKIYSADPSRAGQLADFDEAISILVDRYPNKDQIIKGSGAGGSGTRDSRGGGGGKTMSRSDFAKLSPIAQQNAITKEGVRVVD